MRGKAVWFALGTAALLGAFAAAGEFDLRETAKLLESRDADERMSAVGRLAKIPGRTSVLLILTALRDADPRVRSRARYALGKRRTKEDLGVVIAKGIRNGHPGVRLACYRHLAAIRAPDAGTMLEDALRDSDPGVREAAAGIFANQLAVRAPQSLAAAVTRGRGGRPRAAALLALAVADPEVARELSGKLRRDADSEVRVASIEVLTTGEPDTVLPMISPALDDPCWSVRLTAARALATLRRPGAVEPLIAALGEERGRMRDEVGEALARLTGVGLPADPAVWLRWWEKEKADFLPPAVSAEVPISDRESVATFHSVPFRSASVAFVLDRSRSMRHRLGRGEEKTKGELVEEGLEATLARLGPDTRFYLVAFATEPNAFTPRPIPAGAGARHQALTWFRKQRPEGRTNLFDALALALGQEAVDTIFVLTDGAPSAGEYQNRTEILAEVKRLNRYRKAVIHTIEVGEDRTGKRWRGFLADLAAMTGGHHAKR